MAVRLGPKEVLTAKDKSEEVFSDQGEPEGGPGGQEKVLREFKRTQRGPNEAQGKVQVNIGGLKDFKEVLDP